jgi:hypothetical protein
MTQSRHSTKRHILIAAVASLPLGAFVLRAILHVRRGEGADTYVNVYGMPIHWITPIVFLGVFILALLVALVWRWWDVSWASRARRQIMRSHLRDSNE